MSRPLLASGWDANILQRVQTFLGNLLMESRWSLFCLFCHVLSPSSCYVLLQTFILCTSVGLAPGVSRRWQRGCDANKTAYLLDEELLDEEEDDEEELEDELDEEELELDEEEDELDDEEELDDSGITIMSQGVGASVSTSKKNRTEMDRLLI